jgi:hypothetical protein
MPHDNNFWWLSPPSPPPQQQQPHAYPPTLQDKSRLSFSNFFYNLIKLKNNDQGTRRRLEQWQQ